MGIAPSSASGGCGGRLSHAVTRTGFADRDDSELDESRGGFVNDDNGGGLNHGQYSGLDEQSKQSHVVVNSIEGCRSHFGLS